jgi:tetratricopeptide (TPR) repeat protein
MSSEANWLEFFQDRERLYADYYLDFAQQHARREADAYEQLEAESGNLLKIAAWLSEHSEAEGILRLAAALWEQSDFLRSRGFMQRSLPLLERAYQVARQTEDLEAEFTWLEALAYAHYSANNFALARPLYEQVLILAQDSKNQLLMAQAHLGMGRLLTDMGYFEQAAASLKQALQNYRDIQNYEGEIKTLTRLGDLLSLQGDFAGAVAYLNQGLPLTQARQDRHGEVAVHYSLGYAAALAQDWTRAILHFEAATDMARAVGDRFFEVRGLTALGEAWLAQGDAQQAVFLLEEALARQEISDDIMAKAFTHFYLAKAYHVLDDRENSLVQLRLIYPYLLETRDAPILAALATEAAWIMADNYLKQGDTNLARTALHDVLNLASNHLTNIRQAAEILLGLIESGNMGSELSYDDIERMRDKREMMRDEV